MAIQTKAQFGQYDKDGFILVNQPVLPVDLVRKARARVEAVIAGEFDTGIAHWGGVNLDDNTQLQRIAQIHICDKTIHQLLSQPVIGELIAAHTGAKKVQIWGSQLYAKPSESSKGGHVGWHRDSQHIAFYRKGLLTLWIPLSESNQTSGPLTYLRGSHKKDTFAQPTGAQEQNLGFDKVRHQDSGRQIDWDEVSVIVPEGGFSFHHWDLIHGSAANQSEQPRYAISVGIATEALELATEQWDYNYHSVLHDPMYCPTLYEEK